MVVCKGLTHSLSNIHLTPAHMFGLLNLQMDVTGTSGTEFISVVVSVVLYIWHGLAQSCPSDVLWMPM